MRIILISIALLSFVSSQGQIVSPFMGVNAMPGSAYHHPALMADSQAQKKWSVSTYIGMGAGIGFFNGNNFAFSGTQIGLQINRRLNNNLYAFAGATITPAYFNFNRSAGNSDPSKNYLFNQGINPNGWAVYPGIQAGLMYVNDAKTFSISGSIGVSNNSYPFYPGFNNNAQRQAHTIPRQ